MLSRVYSGAVYGVNAYAVEIEVNAGRGEPQFVIVGLPDAAVRESKDRVWTAIHNAGSGLTRPQHDQPRAGRHQEGRAGL
jgi:magnesium chelatase family protein